MAPPPSQKEPRSAPVPPTGRRGTPAATPPASQRREPRPPPLAPLSPLQRSAVDLLGDLPQPVAAPSRPPSPARVSEAQASAVARAYEKELRERYQEEHDAPLPWFRRHWLGLTLAAIAVVAALAAVGLYALYRRYTTQEHRREFLERAQQGLLQDTRASVEGAAHQLQEVLEVDPENARAIALDAQAAATLWREYDAPESLRDAARAALADRTLFASFPDAVWTAKYLLGDDPPAVAAKILAIVPARAGPWIDYLAGKILLGRGETSGALARFETSLKRAPTLVPALLAAGDYYLGAGDLDHAAALFGTAHAAAVQSVGAAVGLAEVHLAQGRTSKDDLDALAAVEAPGAAAIPAAWRLRLDVASARVLAALGRGGVAIDRLEAGAANHPADAAAYEEAIAEVDMASGRYAAALQPAREALAKAPDDGKLLARYAHVLLGLSRPRDVLDHVRATGADPRPIHLLRAVAAETLGDCATAKREVDATRKGDRIPARGAVVVALCDAREGRTRQARAALQQLAGSTRASAAALVALGGIELDAGDLTGAEKDARRAAGADPAAWEPRCLLGRVLLARGKIADGQRELEAALKLDEDHVEARTALGLSFLAQGQSTAAVKASPEDEAANLGLARALLAEGQIGAAFRYGTRATQLSPGDAEAHRWLARIAGQAGQRKLARQEARTAARLAGGRHHRRAR